MGAWRLSTSSIPAMAKPPAAACAQANKRRSSRAATPISIPPSPSSTSSFAPPSPLRAVALHRALHPRRGRRQVLRVHGWAHRDPRMERQKERFRHRRQLRRIRHIEKDKPGSFAVFGGKVRRLRLHLPHDSLHRGPQRPIRDRRVPHFYRNRYRHHHSHFVWPLQGHCEVYTTPSPDRKSTRLNSSHLGISYAVFCL